jgi:hypothetical protein
MTIAQRWPAQKQYGPGKLYVRKADQMGPKPVEEQSVPYSLGRERSLLCYMPVTLKAGPELAD